MKVEQFFWSESKGWAPELKSELGDACQLALLFGSTELIKTSAQLSAITGLYPNAQLMGCRK